EVMIELGDRSREERSRKIKETAGQAHQWLRRRAQAGANVIGVEIRRLDRVFPFAHLAFPPPPLSSETSETLPPPLSSETSETLPPPLSSETSETLPPPLSSETSETLPPPLAGEGRG